MTAPAPLRRSPETTDLNALIIEGHVAPQVQRPAILTAQALREQDRLTRDQGQRILFLDIPKPTKPGTPPRPKSS
jgi:hypothetical protein